MLIHKQIRKEFTELLKRKSGIDADFIAGRPGFLDLDEQQITIAVFIDEATLESQTTCDSEWRATLNVAIYRKSLNGEGELDDVAEKIIPLLAQAYEDEILETIGDFELKSYAYDQDTQQRTWFTATLQYDISYTN